jgi:hypothetical protein
MLFCLIINMHTKIKTLENINYQSMAAFLGLAGIAMFIPFVIKLQWLTGPIVNAVLIIALLLIGLRSAIILCFLPSLIALSSGLLPAPLAPVVPFIMIGNVILVLTVDWFYNYFYGPKGYWLGVVFGAAFKFLFLFLSVYWISGLIKSELIVRVMQMMSWPQFATALGGGIIAWFVLKFLKKL